jgi:hypothetical protein
MFRNYLVLDDMLFLDYAFGQLHVLIYGPPYNCHAGLVRHIGLLHLVVPVVMEDLDRKASRFVVELLVLGEQQVMQMQDFP